MLMKMQIKTDIDDWSLEHDRAVRDIIRNTAINYRHIYNELFPEDVMVVGGNWFYIGEVKSVKGLSDKPIGNGSVLALSQAIVINPRQAISMPKIYIPLSKILEDFKKYLPNEEMALFSLSEKRKEETRSLGNICQSRDD